MKVIEPSWISLETVYAFQARQIDRFGGLHGVRDGGLIESAVVRLAVLAEPWQYYVTSVLYCWGDPGKGSARPGLVPGPTRCLRSGFGVFGTVTRRAPVQLRVCTVAGRRDHVDVAHRGR